MAKQTAKFLFLAFVLLVFATLGCKSKKTFIETFSYNHETFDGVWKIYQLHTNETTFVKSSGNTLFLSGTLAKIQLERNQCSGHFFILNADSAVFSSFACTMYCCDTPLDDDLLMILQECSHYKFANSELKLYTSEGDTIYARKISQ